MPKATSKRHKVRKAIIPVAGMGTRFLPATKAQPKEMLTLVDKPVIQYIVEEAVAAGIEQIIFVTSGTKRAIEDHFDRSFELEYRLSEKGKKKELKEVVALSDMAQFFYVRQKSPRGDGHAVLAAEALVGGEPCAIFFGDDIIDAREPAIGQMMRQYERYLAPVLGVSEVAKEDVSRYGVIGGAQLQEHLYEVREFREKPTLEEAPSRLVVCGRAIITPEVFETLHRVKPGKDGEIRLADAYQMLLREHPIFAWHIRGIWYDCGNKLEFLKAIISQGLKHPELKKDFLNYLKALK